MDFDEDPFLEEISTEEPEFEMGFEQLIRLKYREETGTITEGISKGVQRGLKTPEEAFIEQMHGFLTDSRFTQISDSRKELIVRKVEKLPNLSFLNVEMLVFASLWNIEGEEFDKKNIQAFNKKYKIEGGISPDFIRYIRMLNEIK